MGEKDHILTKDEVYTSEEAMQIIGVAAGRLYSAIAEGTLHAVTADEVYGLHGKRKYLLRSEIDPLRGLKTLRKDTVHFVWNNPGLSDRAIQEGTYGDPIQKYGDIESELDRIHAKNPTAIWDYITNKAFKGWKIVMESPGARQ